MNIVGIVCEYNPFHNGHEYHLVSSKAALGEDTPVICVMSGDFVQRGEAAMFSKFARAEAACKCGADLVVELPLPWAISSAEKFSEGAVGLLAALGVTHLSFGSEAGETEALEKIAKCLADSGFNEKVKAIMARDASLSYAAARQMAVYNEMGSVSSALESPNNILGIEYIKAIYKLGLDITPITVQRYGSAHDKPGNSGPKSASELRKLIIQGKDICEYIPHRAAEVLEREKEQGRIQTNKVNMELAILSRLRMFDENYFESLPDASDGLANRLFRAVNDESTLDGIYASAKTKRYALSRIRRICICACLGVKAGMNEGVPPYARVLAANKRGCELLRILDGKCSVPIISKPASVRQLSSECTSVFATGASAHDFFTLGYRAVAERKCGVDWKTSPKIVQNI